MESTILKLYLFHQKLNAPENRFYFRKQINILYTSLGLEICYSLLNFNLILNEIKIEIGMHTLKQL